uniref:Putative S-adenosyl-L-methionine-dependent methyltransferase MAB_3787 n=1 Tax=Anthurium amnicola TaxID=1678845 RepID=A0A1D1XK23_9ARAE
MTVEAPVLRKMSEEEKKSKVPEELTWPEELKLPELLVSEKVRSLHATIDREWGSVQQTALQTAAGRALWKQVIHDQYAEVLAGERYLGSFYEKIRRDQLNKAQEVSGVIIAVRTLWFDSKLENAINSFKGGEAQVVLLGAGMDARAYRLRCLSKSSIFEVDFPELLETKAALLQQAFGLNNNQQMTIMAKSLIRVAADIRDNDWLEKLQRSGFVPEKNTVWLLEGILYYLPHLYAMQVLQSIAANCSLTRTVLLADFMNKSAISISHSNFHFYCDWPDQLLPSLGFSQVNLSQIGDPDAHFGLMHDPDNLFNKLRNVPRSLQTHPDDGTPCHRLYLVEASGSPHQATK